MGKRLVGRFASVPLSSLIDRLTDRLEVFWLMYLLGDGMINFPVHSFN